MQFLTWHKKITIVSTSILIWILALSLVSPALSEKPDKASGIKVDNGRDTAIEIYWDEKGVNRVSTIDWGRLDPGGNTTLTMFVKNRGKNPVVLSYYTSDWNPIEAQNYFELVWDYAGQQIKFKEMWRVTFILSVSENIEQIESFSFDTIVVAM